MAKDLAKLSYFISLSEAIFCFSEIVVSGLNLDLVVHGVRLPVSAALDDGVRVLGHVGELQDGGGELLNTNSAFLFKKKNTTRLSVDIIIFVFEFLLSLVHLCLRLHQLLHDLLQVGLKLLDFLASITDVCIKPVAVCISISCGFLNFIDLGVHLISLRLYCLHFLPNGVHCCLSILSPGAL